MNKKKLLVTASTFPRWEGDTEPRFILDLCLHLTNKYDITVLVPAAPGAKDFEVWNDVKIKRYHYFLVHRWETLCYPGAIVPRIKEKKVRILLVPFLLLSLYFNLLRYSKEADFVHAHWLIPQGIVQSFIKKPYLVTGHGGDVTSLNKGILKALKIRCLKRAKHITVVSEHLKHRVLELVPTATPSVISMGVDMANFGIQHRVPNYFNQNGKKVILFVGRLAEKKGVTYLIDAMRKVDALLVIAGDGPLMEELKTQAHDISDKIIFLGSKTHDELPAIYASADVFAAPSVTAKDGDQEGFGLVMLEAMASGLPVVANNSGGISQLIHHNENGLLCEEKNIAQLADTLSAVLNDSDLYSRLAEASLKTAGKYDYHVIAQKYDEIIERSML